MDALEDAGERPDDELRFGGGSRQQQGVAIAVGSDELCMQCTPATDR